MGWTAAGGHYLPASESLASEAVALLLSPQAAGGYLLAALLFAWQFPHFNALSHPIRHEYLSAGYKMAVSLRPALNARVALRYALLMFPICFGLTAAGVHELVADFQPFASGRSCGSDRAGPARRRRARCRRAGSRYRNPGRRTPARPGRLPRAADGRRRSETSRGTGRRRPRRRRRR